MKHLPWYLFSGVWLGWLFCVIGAFLGGYLLWRRLAPNKSQQKRILHAGLAAALGFGVSFGFIWQLGDFALSSDHDSYDSEKSCYQDTWSGWLFLGSLSPLTQERLLGRYETRLESHCEQTQARVEAWVALQERQARCRASSRKLSELGRFQEAIASGERCSDAESQRYVAYAQASLGDFAQAAKTLHQSAASPSFPSTDISILLQAGDVALASSFIKSHLAWLEKTQRETDDPSHVLYGKGTPGYYPAKRRSYQCLLDALGMRAKEAGARERLEAAIKAEDTPDPNNYTEPVCRTLLADQLSGRERLLLLASTPNQSRLPCLLALEVDTEYACAAHLYQGSVLGFFGEEAANREIALVSSILSGLEGKASTPKISQLRAQLSLELGIFEALVNHPAAAAQHLSQAEREALVDSGSALASRLAEGRLLLALRTGAGMQEAITALPKDSRTQRLFSFYAELREGRNLALNNPKASDFLGFSETSSEERQSLVGYVSAKDGGALAKWLYPRRENLPVLFFLSLPEFDAAGKSAMSEWFRWGRRGFGLEHHLWISLEAEFSLSAQEAIIWERFGDVEEAKRRREAIERYYQAYLTREMAVPLALLSGSSF